MVLFYRCKVHNISYTRETLQEQQPKNYTYQKNGADTRIRTEDRRITNALLYH